MRKCRQSYFNTILISIFAYVFSLFLVRLVGRKTVSQITFFDFVLGVSLGTITASIALGPNRSGAVLALLVFAAITILADFLQLKNLAMKKLINSEPVVLIENGKIIDQNLRRIKLTLGDLQMQLRQKNAFNVSDVEFAIMETNGKVSVLLKSQKQPVTPSDLQISTSYIGLGRDIILDGEIMVENLYDAHLDEGWLVSKLKEQGISCPEEVFYAGLDTSGYLYISKKRDETETGGKHGIE